MKRLLLILALAAGTAQAQLVVSDFSHFAAGTYSQAFDGPWSAANSQSGATAFTIADFGAGAPSGQAGNAFVQWLPVVQDWSAYTSVSLTGRVTQGNATPRLSLYIEDESGNTALTAFELLDFGTAFSTKTEALNFGALDATRIAFWGFVVSEAGAPEFGFAFDQLQLDNTSTPVDPSAVPEPGTYGALGAVALLAVAGFRRRLRRG